MRTTTERWTKRDYAAALEARGLPPPEKPQPLNVAERFASHHVPPPAPATEEAHPFMELVEQLKQANAHVEAARSRASDALMDAPRSETAAALEKRALAQVSDALARGRPGDAKVLAALAEQMRRLAKVEAEVASGDEDKARKIAEAQEEQIQWMFGMAAWLACAMVFQPCSAPVGFLVMVKRWREINLGEGEQTAEAKARVLAEAKDQFLNGQWEENLPEDARAYLKHKWEDMRERLERTLKEDGGAWRASSP